MAARNGPQRREIARLIEAGRPSSIAAVATLLESLQPHADAFAENPDNGIACFNRLYSDITRHIDQQQPTDDAWQFLIALDIEFARRYLWALRRWCSGESCPRSWRTLFDRHAQPSVEPVQFALGGVLAHVLFDLGPATATVAHALGQPLVDGSPWHRTFLIVNDVFEKRTPPLRTLLQPGMLNRLAEALPGQKQNETQQLALVSGRASAWRYAQALSMMPGPVRRAAESAQDVVVATMIRSMLSSVGRRLMDPTIYAFGGAPVMDSVPQVIRALLHDLEEVHGIVRDHQREHVNSPVRVRPRDIVFTMNVEASTHDEIGLRVVGARLGGAQVSRKGNVLEYRFTTSHREVELNEAVRAFLTARSICMMDLSDIAIYFSDEQIRPSQAHIDRVRMEMESHLRDFRLRLAELALLADHEPYRCAELIKESVEKHVLWVRQVMWQHDSAEAGEQPAPLWKGVKERKWVLSHRAQLRLVALFREASLARGG